MSYAPSNPLAAHPDKWLWPSNGETIVQPDDYIYRFDPANSAEDHGYVKSVHVSKDPGEFRFPSREAVEEYGLWAKNNSTGVIMRFDQEKQRWVSKFTRTG